MKAYKTTLLVVDHDGLGAQGIQDVLENQRYPNHCLNPQVMETQEADIGEWRDGHPLNYLDKQKAEFERLFAPKPPEPSVVQWCEPCSIVGDKVCSAPIQQVIDVHRGVLLGKGLDAFEDQEVLQDFLTIHWAWLK